MNTAAVTLPGPSTRYARALRWIGSLLDAAADRLDRRAPQHEPLDPMPRHTSFDEVVGDLRNRINSGFGGGQRPFY
jgi:hypothetical protein